MPMGSIAETIAGCLAMQLARLSQCGGALEGTFTLYRRTLLDPTAPPAEQRSDLGIQVRAVQQNFRPVATDQLCVFSGTSRKEERWEVNPEGQEQVEKLTLFTAYPDVREGDNLVLSWDDKTYLVEASSPVGPLTQCFLSTAETQL